MERVLDRRRFLRNALLSAGAILAASCKKPDTASPGAITSSASESYALVEQDGVLVDVALASSNYPFLEAIKFSFDPDRAGGSLVLDATLKQGAEVRLVTYESDTLSPDNPGFIYCASSLEKTGSFRKFPAIRVIPREEYLTSIGIKLPGEPCIKTFQDMRTYYLTKDGNGKLQARFEGIKTFDPNDPSFKPRDDEAAQARYWNKDCLS